MQADMRQFEWLVMSHRSTTFVSGTVAILTYLLKLSVGPIVVAKVQACRIVYKNHCIGFSTTPTRRWTMRNSLNRSWEFNVR